MGNGQTATAKTNGASGEAGADRPDSGLHNTGGLVILAAAALMLLVGLGGLAAPDSWRTGAGLAVISPVLLMGGAVLLLVGWAAWEHEEPAPGD